MPRIPTIKEIYSSLSNDLRNRLNISDNDLKTVLDAVASTLAAQFKLTYLYLDDIQNNVFVDTADSFEDGGTLDRIGAIYLNRQRRPALGGTYQLQVTGITGTILRPGLTFQSNTDASNPGKFFILDAEYEILNTPGINDYIQVRSLEAGTSSLLIISDELTATEPVIGLDDGTIVYSITIQPLSAETVNDYRSAILNSIQLEPQGGSKTDYRLWSSDAQGVRLVYPYVKLGEPGVVQVYVEAVAADSLAGNGVPTQLILDTVADVIDFDPDQTLPINDRGRRPIQADIEVLPIILNQVDVTIIGLNIDTAAIRTNIEVNISKYLEDIRPFVDGADLIINKNDIAYSARVQAIVTDSISSSNYFTDFFISINGSQQNSYIFERGNIPYLANLIIN
jgi:uncharacterized phage protein gp47/JayE